MSIGFALTGVIAVGVAALFLFVFNDNNKAAVNIPNTTASSASRPGPRPGTPRSTRCPTGSSRSA